MFPSLLASVLAVLAGVAFFKRYVVVPLQPLDPHLPPLSEDQRKLALDLETHVRAIASVPHNLDHQEDLENAALYIEKTLSEFGHHVRWQVFEVNGQSVRNIEVVLEPETAGDPTLIVGAHYDSAENSPGANDNGTGVAALLEMARALKHSAPALKRRLRLVFFVNEEQPYGKTENMGALRHARALIAEGEKCIGMIALETLGYFSNVPKSQRLPFPFNFIYSDRGNFVAFIGLPGAHRLLKRAVTAFRASKQFPATGTIVPSRFEGADLSDHWAYKQVGIPALMITDTAPYRNPFYHQTFDTPDTVDYGSLARIVEALDSMVRALTS